MHLVRQVLEATTQVNGPEHYREGEQRMLASDYQWQEGQEPGDAYTLGAIHEALMAIAHFTAALTASHAAHHHPESVAWSNAINGTEQP